MVALGVGLLIGAERERRKQQRSVPSAAGIRTFTVATLAGAVSLLVGGPLLLAVIAASTAALTALAYWRARGDGDPGITTEVALVLAVLIGALAVVQPKIAASLGVVVAIVLAARTPLHHFVGAVLTQNEVNSGLLLAGATLVVLPLLPSQPVGPYQALNLHSLWLVVILMLTISAAGHVAIRTLGARFGLPLAGLASGFVSSTAAIATMSARAGKTPNLLAGAVAGAVLSTVATIVQIALLLAAISRPTLQVMAGSLTAAGLAAATYGAVFTLRALRQPPAEDDSDPGKAFSLLGALAFAGTLAVVLVVSAALNANFGSAGAAISAAASGLVDSHAAVISMASLVASGHMDPPAAAIPILLALTSNTATKMVLSLSGGGRPFVGRVAPGLLLVVAAAWLGWWGQTQLGW